MRQNRTNSFPVTLQIGTILENIMGIHVKSKEKVINL